MHGADDSRRFGQNPLLAGIEEVARHEPPGIWPLRFTLGLGAISDGCLKTIGINIVDRIEVDAVAGQARLA
jgi:hypothetical protein